MFKRRLGPDIHAAGPIITTAAEGCPDLWELDNGDIAVIGIRKTSVLSLQLPPGVGCGPDEEIVVIPRSLLIGARSDIDGLT